MSFDLNLGFKVETTDLKKAVDELDTITNAINRLNKAQSNQASVNIKNEKAAIASSKAAEAAAKAAAAQAKADKEIEQANLAKAKATEISEKATVRANKAVRESVSMLERYTDIQNFMVEGFSKGQATVLATAKAAGQLSEELGGVLKTIRQLQGGDPFDKSISGLISMQNKLYEVNEAMRLYEKGISLTRDQTREFARDKERLILKMEQQGKTQEEINASLEEHENKYVAVANVYNTVIRKEQEHVRAQQQTIRSTNWLVTEEEKMRSVLSSLNDIQSENTSLNEKSARSIANYERNLRQAGVTGEDYSRRLDVYKNQQKEILKVEQQRQIQYLQRGLQPQIGDVVVSLASGQNPLTVMLQQGDQIRGLIAQTGVQGKELEKAMAGALAGTVLSIKQTAGAMLSLLGGAIVTTSTNIGKLFVSPLKAFGKAKEEILNNADKIESAFDVIKVGGGAAFRSIGAAAMAALPAIGTIAAVLGTVLTVAYAQIVKEEGNLTRALVNTGAMMGLNKDAAIELARSFNDISESKAKEALTEFAKAGINPLGSLRELTEAAVNFEKYGGVALSEIAKDFASMQKDPVQGLIKLGKETGTVTVETLKQAAALEKAQKYTELNKLFVDQYTKSIKILGEQSKANLSPIEVLFGDITKNISDGWNAIKSWANSPAVLSVVSDTWKGLLSVIKYAVAGLTQFGTALKTIYDSAAKLSQGNLTGAFDTMKTGLADVLSVGKNVNKEIADMWANKKFGKATPSMPLPDAATLKANAEAVDVLARELKKQEKNTKDAEAVQNFYNDELRKGKGLADDFTHAQENMMRMTQDDKFFKLSMEKRIELLNQYVEAHHKELKDKADKEEAKRLKEVAKAAEEAEKVMLKYVDAMMDFEAASDAFNEQLAFQYSLFGKSAMEQERMTREYQKQAKIRQVQVDLENEIRKIEKDTYGKGNEQLGIATAAIITAREQAAQKIVNIENESAFKAAEAYRKEFDRITGGISDAIETALFEGGQAGKKKLRDVIVAELRKPITIFINAVVQSVGGNIMSAILGTSNGSGSASNVLSSLNSLSSINNLINSSAGSSIGAGVSAVGNAFGSSSISAFGSGMGLSASQAAAAAAKYKAAADAMTAAGNTAGAAQMSSTAASLEYGSMAGSFAGYGAGAAVGQVLGRGISNGYSAIGGSSGSTAVNAGTIIGAIFGGPIGSAIGGAIGGIVNRAFGRKLTETGITGTFGNNGFDGSNYRFEEGGWFRSDRTSYSQLDQLTKNQLSGSFSYIKYETENLAKNLGINADLIKGYTTSIKLNFKGMSEEEATKRLADEFTKIQNDMISKVFSNITDYQLKGEDNITTLKRMVDTLGAVNSALGKLHVNLLALSIAGYSSAESLIKYFGDVNNLNSAVSSFYDNYFTEQEKTADLTKLVTDSFKLLNISVPKTREEYKKLVQSQDLTIESGRRTWAALIDLSDEFANLVPAAESASTAIEKAKEVFADFLDNLIKTTDGAIDKQIESTKYLQSAAAETAKEFEDAAKSIRDTINKLFVSSASATDLSKVFKANVGKALGGDVEAMKTIGSDAENYLAELKKTVATKADYDLQVSYVKRQLEAIATVADTQANDFNYTAKLYEVNVAVLEAIKETISADTINLGVLREQLHSLNNINNLIDTNQSGVQHLADMTAILNSVTTGNTEVLKSIESQLSNREVVLVDIVEGNRVTAQLLSNIYYAVSTGKPVPVDVANPTGLDKAFQDMRQWFSSIGSWFSDIFSNDYTDKTIPAAPGPIEYFASGGNFSGGLRVVGENGPELELTGPSRIYSAGQTASMLSGGMDDEKMDRLIERIDAVEAAVRSTAISNNKIAKILDRVTPNGQSIQTSTV